MPRRIDIELTSELPDGSWTWRAAGAKNPKGTVTGEVLPDGSAVGQVRLDHGRTVTAKIVAELVQATSDDLNGTDRAVILHHRGHLSGNVVR